MSEADPKATGMDRDPNGHTNRRKVGIRATLYDPARQ
jgi:hypothetical protein